jgi:hypothetical protein
MSSKPSYSRANPADIAREAFRRLAVRRIAPTPEAYRDIYNEIAGIRPSPPPAPASAACRAAGLCRPGPESVLSQFATKLTETPATWPSLAAASTARQVARLGQLCARPVATGGKALYRGQERH